MMTNIFDKFLGRCCLVYIDDLIIFSKSWSDHMRECEKCDETIERSWVEGKDFEVSFLEWKN